MNIEGSAPPRARQPIRLLLVDDHPLLRAGVRTLLESRSQMQITEADSITEAAAYCQRTKPDVVLLDMRRPTADAVRAVQQLHRACGPSAVVILGRSGDDEEIFRAVVAGAAGHVDDSAQPHELVRIIEEAARGFEPIGRTLAKRPAVGRRVLETYRQMHEHSTADSDEIVTLSERELGMLRHAADGLTNRRIATAMGLSEHTVKSGFSKILGKLGMRHRTEAVVHAVRAGWISVPIVPDRVAVGVPGVKPALAGLAPRASETAGSR